MRGERAISTRLASALRYGASWLACGFVWIGFAWAWQVALDQEGLDAVRDAARSWRHSGSAQRTTATGLRTDKRRHHTRPLSAAEQDEWAAIIVKLRDKLH